MQAMSFAGILPVHNTGCAGLSILRVSLSVRPMLAAYSWLDAGNLHSRGTCLAVVARLTLCQGGEEEKKGWSFQEVLVIYFLPFNLWAGVPFIKYANYMRGLHAHPSHISLILTY